jgi:peptidoglycan DL-endopeptidase CwlO
MAALGAATPIEAQTRSAASIRSQLDSAAERLSQVTEAYDEARLRRTNLDAKVQSAEQDLARSEARLGASRDQLGKVVRDLYMHPVAALSAVLEAKTFGEFERGSVLAGRVVGTTDGLILATRRARAQQRSSAVRLSELRDEARGHELAIGRQRQAAAEAFQRTQALLEQVGRSTLEAERQADLAAAAGEAASKIRFVGAVRPGAAAAVRAAASQIGKPYRWGAAGPDSYDCSGLTMWAWAHGGVSLPHSSRAQYASLPKVPLSQLAPGDLIFRGSPIHHVSIYAGGGRVITAPQTGETVRYQSAFRGNIVGAARP